jgi:sporulation-control protein spo0M
MDIAPCPGRRRDCAHDRVVGRMKMLGRVLARRGIAAANVTARLALAKLYPNGSLNQTFLTSIGRFRRWEIPRG